MERKQHMDEPVLSMARQDFTTLKASLTVQEALDAIRTRGAAEQIVYFYVVDDESKLIGVLPTRKLLTAELTQVLSEVMIPRVVSLPTSATLMDACEYFVLYKYFAFPVVDGEQRIVGVVDVSLLTEEAFDLAEIHEKEQMNEIFETIGFHVEQLRHASPLQAFRFRFPWLLTTIVSGTGAALLTGAFEATLARSLVLAFFLTLVLGLGESVSMQSMTLAIQELRNLKPSWGWYFRTFRREILVAVLLGAASGLLTGLLVWGWRGSASAAVAIGCSILIALSAACVFGISVPTLLHTMRLDPKISAGPLTLAFTDLFTLFCYFTLGTLLSK